MKNLLVGTLIFLAGMAAADITKAGSKRTHHEVFQELGADARADWVETCDGCGLTFEVHALVTGAHLDSLHLSLTYVTDRARSYFERKRRGVPEWTDPFSAERK